MNTKIEWVGKSFNKCFAVGRFLLFDTDIGQRNRFTHKNSLLSSGIKELFSAFPNGKQHCFLNNPLKKTSGLRDPLPGVIIVLRLQHKYLFYTNYKSA
jgi:hypothetical protein